MDSERPPSSGIDACSGSAIINARGVLRGALGAVRNLSQLLHSVRVAPKALMQVLPDVLEACAQIRASVQVLLEAVGQNTLVDPARAALEAFFEPRIGQIEQELRTALARPLNAKNRLALEDVINRCSFELDAARGLLQLLEDANCERSIRVDPRDLVREAFTSSSAAQAAGRPVIHAVLSTREIGHDVVIAPRVAMTLIALGVELVALRQGLETPALAVSSDALGACSVRIQRVTNPSGEPLELSARGIFEPTLPCLRAAAALVGSQAEWNAANEEFTLSYPMDGGAARAG